MPQPCCEPLELPGDQPDAGRELGGAVGYRSGCAQQRHALLGGVQRLNPGACAGLETLQRGGVGAGSEGLFEQSAGCRIAHRALEGPRDASGDLRGRTLRLGVAGGESTKGLVDRGQAATDAGRPGRHALGTGGERLKLGGGLLVADLLDRLIKTCGELADSEYHLLGAGGEGGDRAEELIGTVGQLADTSDQLRCLRGQLLDAGVELLGAVGQL